MAHVSIISSQSGEQIFEGAPRYIGAYLKPGYLEFQAIGSPTAISWHVGDYVVYPRTGKTYRLYRTPQIAEQGDTMRYGAAFLYENVQFFDDSKRLELCPFTDLVPGDNTIHFSTQNVVSFFGKPLNVAERVQACLENQYGAGTWEVRIVTTTNPDLLELLDTEVEFSVSGASCQQALDKVYELWNGLGWIHTVENGVNVITIGASNVRTNANTTVPFAYDDGLVRVERSIANADQIGTRLFAYGSMKNMDATYYRGLDIKDAESVDIEHLMIPLANWGLTDNKPDARKAFIEDAAAIAKLGLIPRTAYFDGTGDLPDIHPTIERMTIGEVYDAGGAGYIPNLSKWSRGQRIDEIVSAVNPTDHGTSAEQGQKYTEDISSHLAALTDTFINNDTVSWTIFTASTTHAGRLTLNFGQEPQPITLTTAWTPQLDLKLAVYVGSKRVEAPLTIRQASSTAWQIILPESVSVSGSSSGLVEVRIEGVITNTAGGQTTVEGSFSTNASTAVTGGVEYELPKTFTVTIPQIGFDIEKYAALGNGKTISMKTGMCAGRDFEIKSAKYVSSTDSWLLTLYRSSDEDLGIMFPNADYQIAAGDQYVLLDIAMPDMYVTVASNRLLEAARKLLTDISSERPFYSPQIDAKVVYNESRVLLEGMWMDVTFDAAREYVLIDSITIDENGSNIPTYEVSLRERKGIEWTENVGKSSSSRSSVSVNGGDTEQTGGVRSVGMTVPTGLTVQGSPITGAGIFKVGLAEGYKIPLVSELANYFELAADPNLVQLRQAYSYLGPRKGLIFEANEEADANADFEKVALPGGGYALHSRLPFYSDSFISAGGISPGGGASAGNATLVAQTYGGTLSATGIEGINFYSKERVDQLLLTAGTVQTVAGVSPVSGDIPVASLKSALGLGAAAAYSVGSVASGNTGLVTGGSVYSAINEAVSSVMKMQGTTTTPLSDGSTTNPVVIDGSSYTAKKGDVVLYDGKEYLWAGSAWEQLGDEASWALKTTSISAGTGLTGGGSLASNRTISLSDSTIASLALANTALQSVAFSDLTSHPTTLSGYAISDAKIDGGVITLGGNTITPVTAVAVGGSGHTNELAITSGGTTTHITVPFATSATTASKLSTVSKTIWGVTYWTSGGVPTNVTGRPTLYIARTRVNTSTANDTLLGITAISNAASSGSSDKSRMVWDADHDAWHFLGNVYADGFISAGGLSSGGGAEGVSLAAVWQSLKTNSDDYANEKINAYHIPIGSGLSVVNGLIVANNAGAVTSVKVGTTTYNPTDGVVSLPAYPTIPTNVSAFTNDAGYLTAHQSLAGYVNALTRTPASGGNYVSAVTKSGKTITVTYGTLPTSLPASDVYAWAKAETKPSYAFSEITGTASASQIPTLAISKISGLQNALNGKQPLDADLTAIAGLTGTSGFLKKTSANNWELDATAYVPNTRTVNGKVLSSNITLTLDDVGNGSTRSLANYVTLSGTETITGTKTISTSGYGNQLVIKRNEDNKDSMIRFESATDGLLGYLGIRGGANNKVPAYSDGTNAYTLYHTGNLSLATLSGSSAIGSSTQPIYYNGSALVACDLSTTYAPYNSAGYLPLTGGVLTNNTGYILTINRTGSTAAPTLIAFQKSGTLNGFLGIDTNGAPVYLNSSAKSYNLYYSGNSNLSTVDWTAKQMTASSFKLASGTPTLTWDANANAWHLSGNFYADGFISAGGISPGGGTSGIDLAAMWTSLRNTPTSASDINASTKIAAAHIPALASLSGNLTVSRISDIETWISGKGYLTDHQSLDGYVNELTRTPSSGGNYVSSVTKSGKTITVTYATLPTALKNPNALTFGSKTYDGSAARTITASDLGALTAHQTVTLASGTNNGTLKLTTAAGVTDNIAVTGLKALAYKSSLAFSELTGTPTTLSGYGISDAMRVIVLEDNGTTTAGTWLAKSNPSSLITGYTDGMMVLYKITVAGASTTTLNINGIGAKTVYRVGTSKLTTHYPVGSYILLYYAAGVGKGSFQVLSDYDANSDTYLRMYPTTGDVEYPLLARYYTTSGSSYYTEYGRYAVGVTLNPHEKSITASKFIVTGGASSGFLKADGSVDSNSYALASALGGYYTKSETDAQISAAIDALPEPMIFKGSLGTGGTITTLPAVSSANTGFTYKVITAGTYQSIAAKVGDTFISTGSAWVLIPSGDEPSGTVTSVGLSVPTGLSVSGSPITTSGTFKISFATGYSIPTTAKQTAWDAKYNKPSTGIPQTDLASALSTKVDHGENAYTNLNDWFEIVNGNIHVKGNRGFYSDSFISAGGLSSGGGSGGIDPEAMWQLLGDSTNEQIAASHITTALNGYVNSLVNSGTGNYVSALSKSGGTITATYGTLPTSLPASDVYAWAKKSSLAASDVPTLAISKISGLQTALNGKQPLDADLTAIAGLTGTSGFLKKTAANKWTLDTNTYLTGITSSMVTNALGYTPYYSGNFVAGTNYVTPQTTLAGYGITDWVVKYDGDNSPDTFTTSGVYRVSTQSGTTGFPYGQVLVVRGTSSSDTIAQIAFAYHTGNIYFRTGTTSSFTSDAWKTVLHGSNYTSYVNTTNFPGLDKTGTVTSVAMTVPTGLSVSGTPITTSGTLAISLASGYSIPTTAKQTNWDTAYGWGNHASKGYLLASTAASTYLPLAGGTMSGQLTLKDFILRFLSGSTERYLGYYSDDLSWYTGSAWTKVWHSGNFTPSDYLPLTGGTINGTSVSPLTINTSAVSNYLFFNTGNVQKAWVGYYPTDGMVLGNSVTGNYLELRDDGTIKYNNGSSGDKQVWWEGNSNTLGFEWACSALGLASSNDSWNAARNEQKIRFFFNTSTVSEGSPGAYYSGVSFMTAYNGMQFAVNGSYGNDTLMFRKSGDSPPYWGDWQSIYHSGNSNLSTVPWACSTLTASGDIHTDTRLTLTGMNIGWWDGVNNRIESYDRPLLITSYDYPIYIGRNGNGNDISISTSGNVGIGTTSPSEKLSVVGSISHTGTIYVNESASNTAGGIAFWGKNSRDLWGLFMSMTSGYGTHGAVSGDYAVYFTMDNTAGRGWIWRNSSTGPVASLNATGNFVTNGAITAGSASDARLKTNIQSLSAESAKRIVMALNPVTFTWNSTATELYDQYKGNDLGFIAQEVEPYLPQAIGTIFEKYMRLDQTKVIAPLVAVAQDHETRIRQLEKENRELRKRLNMN